jgi:hypothetical protein
LVENNMSNKSKLTAILAFIGFACPIFIAPATVRGAELQQPTVVTQVSRFSCGPNLLTFVVKSLDRRVGEGVRCVKPSDPNPRRTTPQLAWYGEGNWQGSTYRHVGHAFGRGPSLVGSASDIFGNGENINNNFPNNLRVSLTIGSWSNPFEIHVTGAWNEKWVRVKNVVYTPLSAPKTCGSYFDEYKVSDLAGSRAGDGLRCMLKVGAKNTTWFGNGQWQGSTYSHLGTKGLNGYGAGDLCHPSFGNICNNFSYGSLMLTPVSPSGFDVTGAWSEKWR